MDSLLVFAQQPNKLLGTLAIGEGAIRLFLIFQGLVLHC